MNKWKAICNALNIIIILLLLIITICGISAFDTSYSYEIVINMEKIYKCGEQAYMLTTPTLRLRFLWALTLRYSCLRNIEYVAVLFRKLSIWSYI